MDDYKHIAEQMKEEIIADYLAKNPGVTRGEIITKTINGQVIVETIGKIFQKAAQTNRKPLPAGYRRLLEKLAHGGDQRYAVSMQSIQSSQRYADWLLDLSFIDFDEKHHQDSLAFLEKRKEALDRKSVEFLYVRKKFTDMMASKTKPLPSLIQTLSLEYLSAVMEQLKLVGAVFNKEVELGELFSRGVRQFIVKHIDDFSDASESVLISIGKTVQYLKRESIEPIDIATKQGKAALTASLNEMENKLAKRRKQYTVIKQLADFLEQLVDNLGAVKPDPIFMDSDIAPKTSVRRMAFTSREGSAKGSRR